MSWGLLHFEKGGYFMAGVNHFHSHSHRDHKTVKSCKRKINDNSFGWELIFLW